MTRFDQMADLPPTQALGFMDENEESMDDGAFGAYAGGWWARFNDRGSRQSKGCTLSFADGVVEYWKWRTTSVLGFRGYGYPAPFGDPDLIRLQETAPTGPDRFESRQGSAGRGIQVAPGGEPACVGHWRPPHRLEMMRTAAPERLPDVPAGSAGQDSLAEGAVRSCCQLTAGARCADSR